jgi:hypothetical protein
MLIDLGHFLLDLANQIHTAKSALRSGRVKE